MHLWILPAIHQKLAFQRTMSYHDRSLLYGKRVFFWKCGISSVTFYDPNMNSSTLSTTNQESLQESYKNHLKSHWLGSSSDKAIGLNASCGILLSYLQWLLYTVSLQLIENGRMGAPLVLLRRGVRPFSTSWVWDYFGLLVKNGRFTNAIHDTHSGLTCQFNCSR